MSEENDRRRHGRADAGSDEEAATAHGSSLPNEPTASAGPARLRSLDRRAWRNVCIRSVKHVQSDNLTTWAAALTYYGILSIFPGLLVLVSVLRLTGRSTMQQVIDNISTAVPGPAKSVVTNALSDLQRGAASTAGILAAVGLVGALWSASGYIGSFMQAASSIYDVPEGRPLWKKLPTRLGITVFAGLIILAGAVGVVFTGRLARQAGRGLGLGDTGVTVWEYVKWPVIILLISFLFAVLYWAAPNVKHSGFKWVTPGSLLAVLVWIATSALFAAYVANFGSYNKTYGSIAAIIIFLVWLWITNLAILFGAEFDAELQRERAIKAGHAPGDEPYVDLRDTRAIKPDADEDL